MTLVNEEVKFIENNLCNKVEGVEILGCHARLITFTMTKTEYRKLTVSIQFPEKYPDKALFVELKSKFIPHEVLQSVTKICDQQLQNYLGTKQVLVLAIFLKKFLDESPLLPCKDELMKAKTEFLKEGLDTMKLKQKQGVITIEAKHETDYAYKFKICVPDEYPKDCVTIQGESNNFPASLAYYFVCQAREIARQSVQKPLDKKKRNLPFQPKPHVYKIIKFLVADCVKTYPTSTCPLCKKNCLPSNPKDIIKEAKHKDYVERIYCGHLYHHGCLGEYMRKPPFPPGGKTCLICNVRVSHDKFNLSPRIAEQRWAHKEARNRELAEVTDFFK